MTHQREPRPDPETGIYVIARPLMFVVWAIALWGTGVGMRLAWLAVTQGLSAALPFLLQRAVWIPILLAVLMWIAVIVAVRGFREHGEQR